MTLVRKLLLGAAAVAGVLVTLAPTAAEARCYWDYRRDVEVCTVRPRVVYRPRRVYVAPPPVYYYAPPPAYYYAPPPQVGFSLNFRG